MNGEPAITQNNVKKYNIQTNKAVNEMFLRVNEFS
jgi:hypothetical protein